MSRHTSLIRLATSSLGGSILVFGLLMSTACRPSDSKPDTAAPTSDNREPGKAEPNGDMPAEVATRVMSWPEIEQFLKSQPGKVVVADVWSTSCIPCMRELPHLFELQQAYPDSLVTVSINIDYAGLPDDPPEKAAAKAKAFLSQHSAAAKSIHLVSSTEDEKVYELADIPSVPAVLVFDRTGKLVKKFGIEGEEFSYADTITPFVKELMKKKS